MCCACYLSRRSHFTSARASPCSATATIWCSVSPPTMTRYPTSTSLPTVLKLRWLAWLRSVKEPSEPTRRQSRSTRCIGVKRQNLAKRPPRRHRGYLAKQGCFANADHNLLHSCPSGQGADQVAAG